MPGVISLSAVLRTNLPTEVDSSKVAGLPPLTPKRKNVSALAFPARLKTAATERNTFMSAFIENLLRKKDTASQMRASARFADPSLMLSAKGRERRGSRIV
jgi:hypothetical protein